MSDVTASSPRGSLMERRFRIGERGSTPRVEALGGLSTFLTMSYIVFVNPAILSQAGVPFAGVAVATALAAGICTIAMGLISNYPLALASGLGINAIVAFDIILGQKVGWPVGMACVVIEGVIAFVLVLAGLREAVVRAVPELDQAVDRRRHRAVHHVRRPARRRHRRQRPGGSGVALGDLTSGPALIALAGIAVAVRWTAVRDIRGRRSCSASAPSTALGLIFGVLDGPSAVARAARGAATSTRSARR